MIIGEVIDEFPGTAAVFKKYFGDGCCDCPGSNNEDIAFGAMMHNVDAEKVVKELNASIRKKDI